jgi:hypothetical protein
MSNVAELRKQAEASVKDRRTGGGVGTDDDAEEQLRSWAYTSWRQALPKEERTVVIKSLQKNLRAHGEERAAPADGGCGPPAKEKGSGGFGKPAAPGCGQLPEHLSITPIRSKVGLDELKTAHCHQASDEPTSNYAEALRDQIRVRTSVNPMVRGTLPEIGKGSTKLSSRVWKRRSGMSSSSRCR